MRWLAAAGLTSAVAAGVAVLRIGGLADAAPASPTARHAAPRVAMITDSVGGVLFRAARRPQLTVARLGASVRTRARLVVDNAHMNESGAVGLVRFLRPIVLAAFQQMRSASGRPPDQRPPGWR